MRQIHGVKRHAERLEHRAVRVAERVRQREERALGPRHPLAQAPVVGAVPREAHRLAEVGMAVAAERAGLARDGRVDRDPPSVLRDPRELVAEHERSREPRLADPALAEPVQVGAAEADRGDAHERLAVARLRALFLVQAQVARRVQAQRAH